MFLRFLASVAVIGLPLGLCALVDHLVPEPSTTNTLPPPWETTLTSAERAQLHAHRPTGLTFLSE